MLKSIIGKYKSFLSLQYVQVVFTNALEIWHSLDTKLW